MQLTVLGNNGPYPGAGGACSGYLLETAHTRLLLDCGTGVLSRLTALLPPEQLDAVILTHLHYDHMSDLLPLIYRCQFKGKRLPLYLPMAENPLLLVLADGYELHDLQEGGLVGDVTLRTLPVRHPVPAYALRLEDAAGNSLCYSGDTNTCEELVSFAREADAFLCDACFDDAQWGANKPHLSARLAADYAQRAGVKQLILTHFSPEADQALLLWQARQVFPKAQLAENGMVLTWQR